MREQEQPRALPSWNPSDEIRPLGHLGVELALDSGLLEVRAKHLGGERLVPRRVDGVEADELAQELDRLVAEADGGHVQSILSA
jgi:hypothetical protein